MLLISPALNAQIERPRVADISSDHGPVQPSRQITLTVHLNMRNQTAFDKAVENLYTPGSPTYHQWMTNSDIARYAPSQADVETVKKSFNRTGFRFFP
jgi:pseudomonalisin